MTDPDGDLVMIERTGTCHTDGCTSNGRPVTMTVPEDAGWACGACGQPITDLDPPLSVPV